MDKLRWILLVIGLLVIAGIYLYNMFKQKNIPYLRNIRGVKRHLAKKSAAHSNTMPEIKGVISPKVLASMDKMEPSLSSSVFNEKKAEQTSRATVDENQQIISFFIKPINNRVFLGSDILVAAKCAGLQFGDMDIFHYMTDESNQAIFSMADMYEPGFFDLDTIQSYVGKGLSVFMQVPTPIDDLLAFELMQNSSSKCAKMLQGDVYNSEHQLVDASMLATMRVKIVN